MGMREQNDGMVTFDGTLERPPILKAWTNSSAVYWVRPSFPATGMMFAVGNADKSAWSAILAMTLHPKRGMWRVYVPGAAFPAHCETRYRIISLDGDGARHVEGEGILRVYTGDFGDIEGDVWNGYASFPGGKVREVTGKYDSTGTPIFSIGDIIEGVKSDDKPIYAYNKATGFYYLVTTFTDEAGEPMLSVSDDPSEDVVGEATYIKDASGFYRRIECAADEAGAMTLQTGELTV